MRQQPTRSEVDLFVKERKYISEMPRVVEGQHEYRMRAPVFVASIPNETTGVMIQATLKKAPPGLPRPYPSAAMEMAGGNRIRGINYRIWHDCPGGARVPGWHEHIWTNEHADRVVIKARPPVRHTSIHGIFEWALKKWRIEVGQPKPKRRIIRRGHGQK